MSALDMPFLVGDGRPPEGPLGRYLPLLTQGVIPLWLAGHVQPGELVLDPFGSSPGGILEAARAGYRVLTCVNNPIIRFMLEVRGRALPVNQFRSTVADVASSRKGEDRLERHILSLYETQCQSCRKIVPAEAFLWNRGAETPYARIYNCTCGDTGEHPVDPDDLRRLASLPPAGLHRSRAVERVAPLDDPTRPDVEEALGVYLARPLYVLFSLITMLDGLRSRPEDWNPLAALLLPLLDEGSSLWAYPAARQRPRQLSIPGQFREDNLWLALERAGTLWDENQPSVEVTTYPELPAEGGICIYPGRFKDLVSNPLANQPAACLTVFPRPSQAFWTLSAVWAGWLWGREAVQPLKSALGRKRYDWHWHAQALGSVLSGLQQSEVGNVPVFGLIPEAETPFVSAVILAAENAGLELISAATRVDADQVQLEWSTAIQPARPAASTMELAGKPAVQRVLEERGEPTEYLVVGSAALVETAHQHAFNLLPDQSLGENSTAVSNNLRRVFADRSSFIHYGGSDQSPEAGSWWLRDPGMASAALADRVELAVNSLLQPGQPVDLLTVDKDICRQFPGLSTPSPGIVKICLESYASRNQDQAGNYVVRSEDRGDVRTQESEHLASLLCDIGTQLGYQPVKGKTITWIDASGALISSFIIIPSAVIGDIVFNDQLDPETTLIVLPGGRSGLLSYKLAHNPRLAQAISRGWRFLKFRHLRSLAANPLLDRRLWEAQLNLDPPEESAGVMIMF